MEKSLGRVHQKSLFVDDVHLGYRRSLTPIKAGEALMLDPGYRLAHLPLVNPRHCDVIPHQEGKTYDHGRHPPVTSLVLPVPQEALEASPAYQELQEALGKAPLAEHIAWDLIQRRAGKLHATLCGGLAGLSVEKEDKQSEIERIRKILSQYPSFDVELRGVFSGNVNVGRLYMKLYPQLWQGKNPIQHIQTALTERSSDLYLVGLHNLRDHLTLQQTAWLMEWIHHWWDRPILRFRVTHLWLLTSCDDLVLDSHKEACFDLAA